MRPALLVHANPCPPRARPPRPLTLRTLAIAAGLSQPALAQTPSFTSDSIISMPLSWSEVNGNNNGVLEPGESAAVRLNVSFTNQFGIASFTPPIGTFAAGTILGFGSGSIDVNGTGGTQGAFENGAIPKLGYGVRSGWRLVGNGNGVLTGTGIAQIRFGQSPSTPELANTVNPIARIYAFLWTPSSYAARSITFSISPSATTAASVYLGLDPLVGARVYVSQPIFGSVNIPIAPSPASLLGLALAPFLTRRRRQEPAP